MLKVKSQASNARKQGFTLIEILIVVAIIGILASVVLVGLGPLQRQGRDARRISDLKQVQTGLELYYNRNGFYPTMSVTDQTGWSNLSSDLIGADIGISNVPIEPNTSRSYLYESDGNVYVLGATLDDSQNAALNGDIDNANRPAGITNISCDDPNYCVAL